MSSDTKELSYKKGIIYAVVCYIIWGIFPVFWKAITDVAPLNILAHRIVWSFAFLILWVLLTKRQVFLNYIKQPKLVLRLGLAGLVISSNWGIFIYAVSNNQIVEAGLGYYMNPLINVFLGFVFLKEGLSKLQKIAVVMAFTGVAYLTFSYGQFPWISLLLATTFGLYGLLKKKVSIEPVSALTIETMMIFPIALVFLLYTSGSSQGTSFFPSSFLTSTLLVLSGLVTAIPLYWFGKSAQVIPLSTLGFIQYINPTLQLLIGVFVFRETIGIDYLICFAFVWSGLGVFAFSIVRSSQSKLSNPV